MLIIKYDYSWGGVGSSARNVNARLPGKRARDTTNTEKTESDSTHTAFPTLSSRASAGEQPPRLSERHAGVCGEPGLHHSLTLLNIYQNISEVFSHMITRKNHTHTHTLTLHEPAQLPPRLPRDHPPQLASLQSQSPGRALLSHPPQRKGSIKCRVRVRVCGVSQRLYPFSKTPQNIINLKKNYHRIVDLAVLEGR